jgi:hypothetical protein
MRRIAFAMILLVAGCAAPRHPAPVASTPPPVTSPSQPDDRASVIGMTAPELVSHFGSPALQIREGNSLKLQFRTSSCVLDAYLYPTVGGGAQRVTHIDARLPSGVDTNAQACAAQLDRVR